MFIKDNTRLQELAVAECTNTIGADVAHRNRDCYLKLTKGCKFAFEITKGDEKAIHSNLIDF